VPAAARVRRARRGVVAALLPPHLRLHLEPTALGARGGVAHHTVAVLVLFTPSRLGTAVPRNPDVVRDVEEAVGAELVGRAATVAGRREEQLLFANATVPEVVVVDLGHGGGEDGDGVDYRFTKKNQPHHRAAGCWWAAGVVFDTCSMLVCRGMPRNLQTS
jgi:hypothetical protein